MQHTIRFNGMSDDLKRRTIGHNARVLAECGYEASFTDDGLQVDLPDGVLPIEILQFLMNVARIAKSRRDGS